jgi:hypothetical protein
MEITKLYVAVGYQAGVQKTTAPIVYNIKCIIGINVVAISGSSPGFTQVVTFSSAKELQGVRAKVSG